MLPLTVAPDGLPVSVKFEGSVTVTSESSSGRALALVLVTVTLNVTLPLTATVADGTTLTPRLAFSNSNAPTSGADSARAKPPRPPWDRRSRPWRWPGCPAGGPRSAASSRRWRRRPLARRCSARAEQGIERVGGRAGLRGGGGEAGAAGAADADQVPAVVNENAGNVRQMPPALSTKLPAMIVFSTMTAAPATFVAATPPPWAAKLALMVSLRSNSSPVKAAVEASMPPPALRLVRFRAMFPVMVELVMVEPVANPPPLVATDAAAAARGDVVGDGAGLDGQLDAAGKDAAAAAAAAIAVDLGIDNRGVGAADEDAAAVPRRGVVDEEAVGDNQGALIVLVGKPPPVVPAKLSASVLFVMVTTPSPELATPPPIASSDTLLVMRAPVMSVVEVPSVRLAVAAAPVPWPPVKVIVGRR